MGKKYDSIGERHRSFIEAQRMFFCATAAADGRVNVSPKGSDTLRVLGPNRVIWLNLTGSGNETAAHVLEQPRMTLMFCAFEGDPRIVRLYGTAETITPDHSDWEELYGHFESRLGARQIFDMTVEMAASSCGFGIPFFDYAGERDTLRVWESRSPA